jgi:type IV secretion system protein VirB6
MPITPFAELYTFFDTSVATVITTGTTNMIALISPLIAAGFGLYVMLVLASYWKGVNDEPVMDFIFRMIAWCAIISCGLNIALYQLYVVPFVNGLGDDLAGVVGPHYGSAAALDTMVNAFLDAFIKLYEEADGIKQTAFAVVAILSVSLFGGAFMVVAIAYIILAKLALGILVAVGPLFIAMALFPATRELFKNWTGQCLNYAFLVMLFSFAAQIEIALITGLIPADLSMSALFKINLICAVMVFVSLNLPSLASALAGGIGISSMVGKFRSMPNIPSIGGGKGSKGGGSIENIPNGTSPSPHSRAISHEQK